MFDVSRHRDIFNPAKFAHPVHVIGCGGMGSRVAEALVRMGVGVKGRSPIRLYDGDDFAVHNLTNQWTSVRHLLSKKVDAVALQMREINPQVEVSCSAMNVKGARKMSGVLFVCVDNMKSRRAIIENVATKNPDLVCVIETRMDAGVGVSHCFDPRNKNQLSCWRLYWHSEKETDNMQGCGGAQSIISAIYGTTTLALRQFETFAKKGGTFGMKNRIYHDFDESFINSEVWPNA